VLAALDGDPTAAPALPGDPPPSLSRSPAADALWWLLAAYLGGDEPAVRRLCAAAAHHPARLVRDAGALLGRTLVELDARDPAAYLRDLRRACTGEGLAEAPRDPGAGALFDRDRADRDRDAVAWQNLGHRYRAARQWDALLTVSGDIAARAPSAGWRYRGDALIGLGRYQDALAAFDRARLYDSTFRSEAVIGKARALTGLGDRAAARAHVAWLAPEVRGRVVEALELDR